VVAGWTPAGSRALAGQASEKMLDATVRYLQNAQNADGGFGSVAGAASEPVTSAWATLALAAAGINPEDQARRGGESAYAYLTAHAGQFQLTTDFERELLVADAAGTAQESFGGVDLVSAVLSRRLKSGPEAGAFVHQAGESTPGVNDTIFAILALSPVQQAQAQAAVTGAAVWLEGMQQQNGGWPAVCPRTAPCAHGGEEAASVEMTSAAIEALNAAGRHDTHAQARAVEYLHKVQDREGGFPQVEGEAEANVASTAWVAQGIWAAGENPEEWRSEAGGPGDQPLGYLAAMQQSDGHLRYREREEQNGLWMTAYAAPALAGRWLPYPAVPHETPPPPIPSGTTPPPSPTGTLPAPVPPLAAAQEAQPGSGGIQAAPGRGVIAGGGGRGAPLFSRPQPGSQGARRGSIRVLGHGAARRHSTRAAVAHQQPVAAASIEPRSGGGEGPGAASITPTPSPGSALAVAGGGQLVHGILVADTSGAGGAGHGAPGLRGAGAGGGTGQGSWLAILIGSMALLIGLDGARRERRRAQAVC
jgi:hypothetical protein